LIVGTLMSVVIYILIYERIKTIREVEKEAARRKQERKKSGQTTVIEEVVNDWDYLFEPSRRK
jgi:hypothetical protein